MDPSNIGNSKLDVPVKPLTLQVAPHLVQDLGLNLYTSLPKVLVEFVANSHDADSKFVKIRIDFEEISKAREKIKSDRKLARAQHEHLEEENARKAKESGTPYAIQPYQEDYLSLYLPESLSIVIEDSGHGMNRQELQDKFLIAGRRRRVVEGKGTTPNGRLLMGRKGLGKLAGFGVGQVMEVLSRKVGAPTATKIELNFKEIESHPNLSEYTLPETTVVDESQMPTNGTIVTLKRLLFEPLKASHEQIRKELAEHFYLTGDDFKIFLNDEELPKLGGSNFAYAWPDPQTSVSELIEHDIVPEDAPAYSIKYRIRFTGDGEALPAARRGIRVYSHGRLAAAPSLLGADTNMHGFRMTDYMDGVVYADAIDDQTSDLIATDRQGLRWETPLLAPLYDFLSSEIREACKRRQAKRDEENVARAKASALVQGIVKERELSKKEISTFERIAGSLAGLHKKGFDDEELPERLKTMADAYLQGNLMSELKLLSLQDQPAFEVVASKIMSLTAEELDGFHKFCRGRLSGIESLEKIVKSVDFKAEKNEDQLHDLLKTCPWLIDPTFFEFLSSNQTEFSVLSSLEKELAVGSHVTQNYVLNQDELEPMGSNKRPDLVFLLGNKALRKILIVELKAPNTPLHNDHLTQLDTYVMKAEGWLKDRPDFADFPVHGYLIGSYADQDSKAEKVLLLRARIREFGVESRKRVLGIDEMLERTKNAHKELLSIGEK